MPLTAQKPKVLVVEDEALLLFNISDDLKEEGFEVFEAANADQAIAILGEHADVGVVFTDIDMPGSMDGLKLWRFVRDRWPPIKIIVTSGKQRPVQGALPDDGIFLAKPYTTASVVDALRGVMGS